MNSRVPYKVVKLLASWATLSF